MITRNTHRHDRQALIFIKDPPLFLVRRGGEGCRGFFSGGGRGDQSLLKDYKRGKG